MQLRTIGGARLKLERLSGTFSYHVPDLRLSGGDLHEMECGLRSSLFCPAETVMELPPCGRQDNYIFTVPAPPCFRYDSVE